MKEAKILEVKTSKTIVFKCPECEKVMSIIVSDRELPELTGTCYNNDCGADYKLIT